MTCLSAARLRGVAASSARARRRGAFLWRDPMSAATHAPLAEDQSARFAALIEEVQRLPRAVSVACIDAITAFMEGLNALEGGAALADVEPRVLDAARDLADVDRERGDAYRDHAMAALRRMVRQ